MEFVGAGLPQSATDTVLITFNYSAAMFFLYRARSILFFSLSFSPSLAESFDLFEIGNADTKNFEWISIGIILRIQNIYRN